MRILKEAQSIGLEIAELDISGAPTWMLRERMRRALKEYGDLIRRTERLKGVVRESHYNRTMKILKELRQAVVDDLGGS